MEKLDNFIAELKDYSEADEQRQAAFYFVRDIPYSTVDSHTIQDAIQSNRANCHAKSELLQYIFKAIGYETRCLVMKYRLRDFPPEVSYIPDQLDYHYVPQILLNDHWVSFDATYDPPLASLGFVVNDWDGTNSTALAEKPLSQKIESEADTAFDREHEAFEDSLKKAYSQHSNEITSYRIKFNEWLMAARQT